MKYKHDMVGPKSLEEWIEVYEERDDSKYLLSPNERVVYDPLHGFFTYCFNAAKGEILIPKMCGDGKYWRPLIYKLAKATQHLGVKSVLCCTKRNPEAYMRIIGGSLRRMEYVYDFQTGRQRTLWFIVISKNDTKEGKEEGRGNDFDSDTADGTDRPDLTGMA
jgi:hypothetical protein